MSKYTPLWQWLQGQEEGLLTLTFDQIAAIAGCAMDHSFLTYKKEAAHYGWAVGKISKKNKTVVFEKQEDEERCL